VLSIVSSNTDLLECSNCINYSTLFVYGLHSKLLLEPVELFNSKVANLIKNITHLMTTARSHCVCFFENFHSINIYLHFKLILNKLGF